MFSLVADYSDSSNSTTDVESSGKEEDEDTTEARENEAIKNRLPSASALLATTNNKKTGEVFSNPYLEAENAKTALLEKHVKMVNKDEHLTEKNGRKICWNYRKGRCRFGSNCHFAHDSDLALPTDAVSTTSSKPAPTLNVDEQIQQPTKKRKHPGLSDAIEPGKRVMKAYHQHQQTQHQRTS